MSDKCKHDNCPYCHRIVVPIITHKGSFETKLCPNCQNVISDVLKG